MSEHTNPPNCEQGAQRSVGEARANVLSGRGPGAPRHEVFRVLLNMPSVRAGYGVALIAAPGRIGRFTSRGPSTPAYRRIIVILGAREVVQALICWPRPTPTLLRVGATVDFIHAASMLSIAAVSKRWRGPAMASGLVALTFAVWGLQEARTHPSHDVTTSDSHTRPLLHFLERLLKTRDHVADDLAQSAARARDHFTQACATGTDE